MCDVLAAAQPPNVLEFGCCCIEPFSTLPPDKYNTFFRALACNSGFKVRSGNLDGERAACEEMHPRHTHTLLKSSFSQSAAEGNARQSVSAGPFSFLSRTALETTFCASFS